jgi:hypothetical protein
MMRCKLGFITVVLTSQDKLSSLYQYPAISKARINIKNFDKQGLCLASLPPTGGEIYAKGIPLGEGAITNSLPSSTE